MPRSNFDVSFSDFVNGRYYSNEKGKGWTIPDESDKTLEMTEKDIDALEKLLTSRCQSHTKENFRRMVRDPRELPDYGIFQRLTKDNDGRWSYCAGQSYPNEIRHVRELIIKG